jgi:hypothetical protein
MTWNPAGVLLACVLALLAAGCASRDEVDARCKHDLEQMRANEAVSERYYAEISSVLVGLSDELDREAARTEADRKAAQVASAVGDKTAAATYASDAAKHEKRVTAINEMLDAPPPPFPETARVSPDEQDWMFMNECANAARMYRIGLESTVRRKHIRAVPDDPTASNSSNAPACGKLPPAPLPQTASP